MKKLYFLIAINLVALQAMAQFEAPLPDPFEDIQHGVKTFSFENWDKQTAQWQSFRSANQTFLTDCRAHIYTEHVNLGAITDSTQTEVFYQNGRMSRVVFREWDKTQNDWANRRQKIFLYSTIHTKIPAAVMEMLWRDDLNLFIAEFRHLYKYENNRLIQYKKQSFKPENVYTDLIIDTMVYNTAGKLTIWTSREFNTDSSRFILKHHRTYKYDGETALLTYEETRDTNAINGGFDEENITYTYNNNKNVSFRRGQIKQIDSTWRNDWLEEYDSYNSKGRPLSMSYYIPFEGPVAWGIESRHQFKYQNDTLVTEYVAQESENNSWVNLLRIQMTYCNTPTTGINDPSIEPLTLKISPNPAADYIKIDANSWLKTSSKKSN